MSSQATRDPPARRCANEQKKVEETLRDLFEKRICFNEVLGLRLVSYDTGGPTFAFDMRAELVGHYLYGRLHGGVISAVLDVAGGAAAMWGLAEKHPQESCEQVMHRFSRLGTIDLRIDYLRPGIGEHFQVSSVLNRLGARIASTQMRLENDKGNLIATGTGAYIVS